MIDRHLSRRSVLKSAAAAVVASPYVIPSAVLGNAEKPPASERVAIGHIGLGNRGRQVLREFQRCKGVQSVACADCYSDRREAVAAQIRGKAYADFRDLLADPGIDAVVIATPDHWHVPIAIAAARAKKDAYVEKPLGVSVEQDLACQQVFEENGRVFQYGTQQRSMPHCHLGCELVRAGKIGKLQRIEVLAPNGGSGGSTVEIPVPKTLDYQMWNGPAPMKPYTADRCKPPGTYWIYDYSIGYLGGWGAHPLDIMVWGSDCDLAGPYTVQGTGVIPQEGLYDTVYNWDVTIQTAAGVEITFKPGSDSTKFIGTEGWIDVRRNKALNDSQPKSLLQAKLDPEKTTLPVSVHHQQNFIDAVKSRGKAVSHLADAVRSDLISQLCNIAIRLRRPVTWDPKQRTIVSDAEAVKMMHRPMREPWSL